MFKLGKAKIRAGFIVLAALAIILASSFAPTPVLAATTPSLGAAGSFSVLAALSMSAATPTTISGDLGLSPGLAVSRTGTWNESGSEYFGPLSLAAVAQSNALGAFNDLAGQSSDGTWGTNPWSPVPGVWTVASDTTFTGTITLNGTANDVWVFQVGRDMTFSGSVILAGTAQSCHVFWQIGRDATIASHSTFVGTLIASRDITLVSGSTVDGRIISLFGALTTDGNTITTPPVCVSAPHLSLTKLVSPATFINIGDVLNYTLVATNDGNTTLTGVSISDPLLPNIVPAPPQAVTLLPGAALTVTGTHAITAADFSAGFFTNTATASVVGAPVPAPVSVTAYIQQTGAHLSLTKTVSPSVFSRVGDVLYFTLIATNDGDTTLTGVSISDPLLPNIEPAPPQAVTLPPGAALTVTGNHTITQGDFNNGYFNNTATASGSSGTTATANKVTLRVRSVGGEVSAENKAGLLAPILGLGMVLVFSGSILTLLWLRRRTSR